MRPIGHMDWIGFGLAFTSSSWIGLNWVIELMDWIGLYLENWTHVQLWYAYGRNAYDVVLHCSSLLTGLSLLFFVLSARPPVAPRYE